MLRVAAAVTLTAGVICQFIQRTDPTAPLAYFTIWSALLTTGVLIAEVIRPRPVPSVVRGAAAVGTVISGIIFATVIVPATPTGTWFQPHDDAWIRTGNVLLHGVAPFLVAADFAVTPLDRSRPWRQAVRWCAWPLLYLVVMFILQGAGLTRVPYSFLDPAQSVPVLIVVAVLVLALLFLLVGRALIALNRAANTRTTTAPRPH